MSGEEPAKAPSDGLPRDSVRALLRKLRSMLVLVTILPLIAFSTFVLLYVPSEVIATGWIATILASVLVLMLAGTQMLFRLIAAVAHTLHPHGEGDAPPPTGAPCDPPVYGLRSVRHTVGEAAALIGVIPLLALGYVVVKYALWMKTTESLPLIACIVAAVLILGIARVNSLTRRIISVAAAARSVRMGTAAPGRDFGNDEIGTLSSDLAQIARNLSTRISELHRTRRFIERLPHPMLVVDAGGTINFANGAALSLLGYEKDEIFGRAVSSLFVRPEDPAWILGEKGAEARENAWRRKNGTAVPVSVRIGALPADDDGGGSVLIATDMSDRERAEAESIRLRNELTHVTRVASLGVLVASLAHEINQPLAAILNNAQAGVELLDVDPLDREEIRAALADIIADDNRASDVIRKIRSMVKKADHEWCDVDVNKTIDGVTALMRRESMARGASIVSDLGRNLPPVYGDGIQLQQVLLNLFLNALEAAEGGPGDTRRILVRSWQAEDGGVQISVCDPGHGIKDEDLSRVFEPFFSTKPGGLGMGLTINKSIIEAHAGRLWAENNPGRGATFHIALPAAKGMER